MKTLSELLVYVDNDRCAAARLELGLELAGQHAAHLIGAYVRRPVYAARYIGTYIPADVVQVLEHDADEQECAAKDGFARVVEGRDLSVEWRTLVGQLPETLGESARTADLLVVSCRYEDEGLHRWYRPDTVVLGSGGPVLVLPPAAAYRVPGAHALIAWNGSREAARAARDALPLLAKSATITIAAIDEDETPAASADALVESLARRGLAARVMSRAQVEAVHQGDAGKTLLSLATESGMDLVVAGAYGHSRVQEIVLGGVTRHLLAHTGVALLMSH